MKYRNDFVTNTSSAITIWKHVALSLSPRVTEMFSGDETDTKRNGKLFERIISCLLF